MIPYTTQQLIDILDQELRANWKGERIVLSWADRLNNPVVAKALDWQKVSKVFAYQDFRRQIHEYQLQHQVSGLIWRISRFKDQSVRFPELHNQLIAIPRDKEILMAAKDSVIAFWWEASAGMNFWLAGDRPQQISAQVVAQLVREGEWAEIEPGRTELYLRLCWGKPQECQYQWAQPDSGCHQIIAAPDKPSAIKV